MKKKRVGLFIGLAVFILLLFVICSDGEVADTGIKAGQIRSVRPDELDWAVYLYLCGSDLETNSACASEDIKEMIQVKPPENVTFIIQTGGAETWHTREINANELGRFVYNSEGFTKVASLPNASMGSTDTLADYIDFCLSNFPAKRQAFIFWNHGGGSLLGICWDEIYDEMLSLEDIATVFGHFQNNVASYGREEQEPIFELIGFDACLMATIDTAFSLLGCANYMVASQELEPGLGWDYTGIVDALAKNPGIDGAEFGRIICDTFYIACDKLNAASNITLSLVDLNRAMPLFRAYDNFGFELLSRATVNEGFFGQFGRVAKALENYGGNSKSEGYTNMVDAGHMARESRQRLTLNVAEQLLDALDECVIYKVAGPLRREASGLSCYYPLDSNRVNLPAFHRIGTSRSVSTYYDYVLTGILAVESRDYLANSAGGPGFNRAELDSAPLVPSVASMGLEDWPLEIDDEGSAILNIGPERAGLLAGVYVIIFLYDDEAEEITYLGRDNNLFADWEEGIFTDNFNGLWTALDGHLVSLELDFEGDDYDLYTVPVLLNDEEYHLQVSYSYETESFTILGARKGLESNGLNGKQTRKLIAGDRITTLFYIFTDMDDEDEEEELYEIETFTIGANPVFDFVELPDGMYIYAFEMEDAQGESVFSDMVAFTIEDGELFVVIDYD